METPIVQQTKHQLPHNNSKHNLNFKIHFKIQRMVWDLSMMRMSYKLTKATTKTEKN